MWLFCLSCCLVVNQLSNDVVVDANCLRFNWICHDYCHFKSIECRIDSNNNLAIVSLDAIACHQFTAAHRLVAKCVGLVDSIA